MPTSGRVIGLQTLVEHRGQPEPVRRAKALVDLGLEGDVHGKKKAGSFFYQPEDGIRYLTVTGVQTCAFPIYRGEVAVRVIRPLHELGIEAVAVYSTADEGSLHTKLADRAVRMGPPPAAESYLNISSVIADRKSVV